MRHLAQANIARPRGPLDSPVMRGFVVALDPANRIAERSEAGQRPTVEEALRRLRHLRAHWPSPQAFTLRRRFEPDGRPTRRGRGG
jgi:hypothetical protein